MADWPTPLALRSNRAVLSTSDLDVCPAADVIYTSRAGFNGNGAWPTANRAFVVQMIIESPMTITQMAVGNAATVAGNLSVGIYDQQFSRLVTSGAVAMAGATAVQVFDITDTALNPGVYYFAMSSDSTTATFNRAQVNGNFLRCGGVGYMETAHPLPTTFTLNAAAPSSYCPLIVGLANGTVL